MAQTLSTPIRFPRIRRNFPYDKLILDFINDQQLDLCFEKELQTSVIGSEQWYRDPSHWMRIRHSTLYKGPRVEKELLERNKGYLAAYFCKTCMVFYGVGVGDVEYVPIEWELSRGRRAHYCEVIAIDICRQFLEDFAARLINKIKRNTNNPTIRYLGVHQKFELLPFRDLKSHLSSSRNRKNSFFCFGNTVANFEPEEIFSIFERNASSQDNLLIGFHKETSVAEALELYKSIPGFRSLVTSLRNKIQTILSKVGLTSPPIQWRFDSNGSWVKAISGDMTLFRSKRYTQRELTLVAEHHRFEKINAWENELAALVLYKKLPASGQE